MTTGNHSNTKQTRQCMHLDRRKKPPRRAAFLILWSDFDSRLTFDFRDFVTFDYWARDT